MYRKSQLASPIPVTETMDNSTACPNTCPQKTAAQLYLLKVINRQ